MKLLKGEIVEKSAQGVTIRLRPISSSEQARVSQLSTDHTPDGRVALANYGLVKLIDRVAIDDESYDPKKLCDNMDLSDKKTVREMVAIGELIVAAAFASDDDKKKPAQ